ncbi:MAG: flagellar basal body L-ring protein FlgH [Planctomycetota bacterium]
MKHNFLRLVIQRYVLAGLALLVAGNAIHTAQAQHNSLLHGRSRPQSQPTPTTQPATSTPLSPVAGIGVRPPRATQVNPSGEPPANPVLLATSPFAVKPPEPRLIKVHDLVTIIIRESRTSLNDAKMKSEKEWEIKADLTKWLRLNLQDHLVPQTFPDGAPGVDFSFDNTYEGKGKYDRKDSLTTRITAHVIDVKPNGNLVLEASKRIKVAEEVLIATLTGECRAEDVSAQNTVLSTQIADLEIEMPDLGMVRDATRRGWLMRLFDLLRPL